ncbi:MAG TPA: DUF3105 domain-containing protein [Gaiellaceae bacterium]|nr:DUF3105 domain-containing protein [Gaiellaceae bacterium]
MARKDRVPNPPRKVQAPKRRSAPAAPADPARRRNLLLAAGAAAVVLAAIVLGMLFLGGGGKSEAAVLQEAGCTLESYPAPAEESDHVALDADPDWNSFPPSNGPHYEVPAVLGFYDEPVPLIQSVHNLEHGAVVIHYGDDVPPPEVQKIRDWYTDDPNGLLVSPLERLNDEIALTAWTTPDSAPGGEGGERGRGYVAKCPRFDEAAFERFVEEHRYKGPERFPPEQLQPGT